MLRYLTLIAPLLAKAPRKNPVQVLGGFMAMCILIALGSLAVLIGIWYALAPISYAVAWTSVGILMLAGATILFFSLKAPRDYEEKVPVDIKTDPIGELLPDELLKDPIIGKIIQQIDEHPMGSMAAAMAVGTIVGQEVFSANNKVVVKT